MAPGEGFEPSRPARGHGLSVFRLKARASRPQLLPGLVHSAHEMRDLLKHYPGRSSRRLRENAKRHRSILNSLLDFQKGFQMASIDTLGADL